MDEKQFMKDFADTLVGHALKKADLYDGIQAAGRDQKDSTVDFFLRCATEELGEVASAITRGRYQLAKEECIDVAHTAMLIAYAIHQQLKRERITDESD